MIVGLLQQMCRHAQVQVEEGGAELADAQLGLQVVQPNVYGLAPVLTHNFDGSKEVGSF